MWRLNRSASTLTSNLNKLSSTLQRNATKATVTNAKVLGIRREDINVWERRAPIAPHHVKELTDKGIDVIVQPSTRRAYTMDEYEAAGAIIQEDLSPASLIIAVKQVPIDLLLPNKSYGFFSHTIKAQKDNMPLLDAMLDKNIRIIDYERMVDDKGKRVAAFGKFAGVGGMINILHGLGLRLLSLGHHTPFMYVGSTHNYKNSLQARLAIYELGEDIKAGKLPSHFGPLTFVFTGSGNVSQGAREVFNELPHVYVHPWELQDAIKEYDHRTLVATIVSREHYLEPKGGGVYNAEEFEKYPERYRSTFAEKIAPYASVLVQGIYWDPLNPRMLTNADGRSLLQVANRPDKYGGCPDLPHRLLALCDISADIGGSIEFMKECTTIERPFALYDPSKEVDEYGCAGDGLLYCSIDNIPAQLPREASDYFGKLLLPWLPEMVAGDATKPLESEVCYTNVTKGAIICSNGKLTTPYEYIADLRRQNEMAESAKSEMESTVETKHRVLVLGAGRVSGPLLEYLSRDPAVKISAVSSMYDEVMAMQEKYPSIVPVVLDINQNAEKLEKLVMENDLVISLLPYSMHPTVAKRCIANNTNMLTASYVTPEMKELHQSAVDAGVTLFQEIGLDPGLDHLLAVEYFDEVKAKGGKIVSFESYVGGLPAPEDAENPLRYKFSWSPLGVLRNATAGATYLKDGKTVEIIPGKLMKEAAEVDMFPGFPVQGYPNRDSTVYIEKYGLKDVKTMLRGTLRYKNYADVVYGMLSLGLLDGNPRNGLVKGEERSWASIINVLLGTKFLRDDDLSIIVKDKVGGNEVAFKGLKDLGLLSDEVKVTLKDTPIETLSDYLAKELVFDHHERDLVLLRHKIRVEWPDGKKETRDISLVQYGEPEGGYSAMAKTVAVPAAIAARMILDGDVGAKGTVVPLTQEIYAPMLKLLAMEGIRWTSKSTFE